MRESPLITPDLGRKAPTGLSEIRLDQSYRAYLFRRFRRHRLAVAGLILVLFLGAVAVLAPVLPVADPIKGNIAQSLEGPSAQHLLGTDDIGRDVLSRVIYGSRISLSVGIVAVSLFLMIGIPLGALAGFYRGVTDTVIMRFTEIVMSFPPLILIVTLVALIGPGLYNVMVAIGLLGWPGVCRLVRGQFLSLREKEFVEAARSLGVSDLRLILRHILPSTIGPIIVYASFGIADAILLEAALSFLGLGVQPPAPSWGGMLNVARSLTTLAQTPWMWIPPGLLIFVTVIAINFVGDGIRDALDPRATR